MGLDDAVERFVDGYRLYGEWIAFVEDAERVAYTSADFEHDLKHKGEERFPDLTERYILLLGKGRNAYSKPLLGAALTYLALHPRQARKAMGYLKANFSEETIRRLSDELFAESETPQEEKGDMHGA